MNRKKLKIVTGVGVLVSVLLIGSQVFAASTSTVLASGNSLRVTCSGTQLSQSKVNNTTRNLSCTGPSTTTTTQPTTTTTNPTTTTTLPTTTTTSPTTTTTQPTTTTTQPSQPGDMTLAWFQANTGWAHTGVTLTTVTNLTTTSNGQVIDGVDVTGTLTIKNTGVVVKRSRLRNPPQFGNVNPTFQDVEIGFGTGPTGNGDQVFTGPVTLTRVDLHGVREGPRSNGSLIITDSYFHDFRVQSGDHADAIQNYASSTHDVLTHNWIDAGCCDSNAALFYADGWSGTLVMDRNTLAGGQFTWQIHESGKLTATNNVVVKGSYNYGPVNNAASNQSGWVWTNNKLSDGSTLSP